MTDLSKEATVSEEQKMPHSVARRRPSTVRRLLLVLVLLLLLAGALGFGFYLHVQSLIANAPKPVPVTVSTLSAAASMWQPQFAAVGSLSAVNGVDVAAQVPGIISSIPVSSGATVKANDVLVQLNIDPDKADLASLQAAAQLSALTLKRDTQLLSTQTSVSQATVDADAADLKSKNALVAQQQALIAEKTLSAPFDGDVGLVLVNLGQYLTPGTVVATLQDLSAMHADFLVPQEVLNAMSPGQAVTVTSDGLPGKTFAGKIEAINSKIDPNTRNATVRALIPNPDRLLRPGMFVAVSVDIGKPEQHVTLPATAITYNSYGSSVFIVKPGANGSGQTVDQVFVTTGDKRGDQVAILKGVTAGQEVVTSGQLKLKNGASVVIDNAVQPPSNPNAAPQEQ
jgi:membrane fusion protein (multidrug efflux system)